MGVIYVATRKKGTSASSGILDGTSPEHQAPQRLRAALHAMALGGWARGVRELGPSTLENDDAVAEPSSSHLHHDEVPLGRGTS